ncbi:hypothetical protein BDF19DRAFT_431350 [Syncephalis fuscata]|nr:hypothetical protein BDF19DRAFT_431350 [Syncephalis fuscata]
MSISPLSTCTRRPLSLFYSIQPLHTIFIRKYIMSTAASFSPPRQAAQVEGAVVATNSTVLPHPSLPDTAVKSPQQYKAGSLVHVSQLQSLWKHFITDEASQQQMLSLIKIPELYISHAEWEFHLGVNTEGQARAIKAELEVRLSLALPTVISQAIYHDVVPVHIPDNKAYSDVMAAIKEHNKLYRHQARQKDLQKVLEMARDLRRAAKHIFIAVDVEAWERDQRRVLEVGWSMYDARRDRYLDQHYNVTEFRALKNGRYVPDLRDNFVFGTSKWASLKEIAAAIQADLDTDAPLVFIGHAVKGDIRYLESLGVKVPTSAITLDTGKLHCAITGAAQPTSLTKLLDSLNIDHYFLHNAGNDAHYTLQAFLELTR